MSDNSTQGGSKKIFLFPLGTVLFPGGHLPLKIFEQRYLEMTKICLRDNLPFGVCLIREGTEVGAPASPHGVGCLAHIEQWEMPQPNMFHLAARGGERFRIINTTAAGNGLISAAVELLPAAEAGPPDVACVALLKRAVEQIGAENYPYAVDFDDGRWVAYRLAELLPLPLPFKQALLAAEQVDTWVDGIKKLIKTNT